MVAISRQYRFGADKAVQIGLVVFLIKENSQNTHKSIIALLILGLLNA